LTTFLVDQLSSFIALWSLADLDNLINKSAYTNDGKEQTQTGDEHKELIEHVHTLGFIGQIISFVGPFFSLLSDFSFSISFFWWWFVIWGERVLLVGTFIVIIISNLWQSCDFLESSMISSNFETDILEISFVSNSDIFVVNWIVSFKATAGIEPTVSVSFLVVLELYENAYGSHSFVSEASIHVLDIDSTTASGISFFSLLFPNVEINTVCWIIWLPL
jgi:hypothetical protein